MSNDAWAIQQLRKHRILADFYACELEAPNGFCVTFGPRGEYQTFYGALQYMVGRLNG